MKKLIVPLLFISCFCFAQTVTKKYNSFKNQYEYFDSNSNMIAYEKYNSFSKQWEYYDIKATQTQPSQYRDPAKVDLSSTFDAATTLQNRYDNNTYNIQSALDDVTRQVKSMNISDENRKIILKNISDSFVKNVMSQRINYSSASETNRIVNWIYSTSNNIINETISSNKKLSSNSKSLTVNRINQYDKNGHLVTESNVNSYVRISEKEIVYKTATGTESYRDLSNKRYNNQNLGYEYTSQWGAIFIPDNLTYVKFYDYNDFTGNSYIYYISQ